MKRLARICTASILISLGVLLVECSTTIPQNQASESPLYNRENNRQVASAEEDLPAYKILGVKTQASKQEISDAYKRIMTDEASNPDTKIRAQIAYGLLSDADLRAQYDESKGQVFEMNIAESDRESMAKLLEALDAPAASRLRKTGRVAANTAGSMATFYLAMGVSEAWHCFRTRDPQYCRSYVESLKEPVGQVGFLLFMGTSHVIQTGTVRYLGDSVAIRTASGFLGMAGGSIASDLFTEFASHPGTKEYFKAFLIKDPVERAKAKQAALHRIWKDTFGNPDWAKDKVPGIISLLLASGASELTWSLGSRAASRVFGWDSCTRLLKKFLETPPPVTAATKWANRGKRVARDVGGLLVFLQWDDILKPHVKRAWEMATEETTLRGLDAELKAAARALASGGGAPAQEKFDQLLKKSAHLWDRHRHARMSDLERILASHMQEVNAFDSAVGLPYLIDAWFVHGMPTTGPEADALASVSDSEKDKHLKAFFCGPTIANSFHDSLDLHGLPIPWRWSPSVEPFRVASQVEPGFCDKILAMNARERMIKLKEELAKPIYKADLKKAHVDFVMLTHDRRVEIINRYESQVSNEVSKIMRDVSEDVMGLPMGIMPAFEKEASTLTALQGVVGTYAPLRLQLDDVAMKRKAAQELMLYMEMPIDKRVPPEMDATALLDAIEASSGSEPTEAALVRRYFNGFIVR